MLQRFKSLGEMEAAAKEFLQGLSSKKEGATVATLSGELGAGKTTFVKGVAKALGVREHITSPTFVIMKIYPVRDAARSNGAGDLHGKGFERLVHIDAYRLKGAQHLNVLGWDELLRDPGNLILIEWPEKIGGALPANAVCLTFRHGTEDTREIDYNSRHVGAV